MIFFLVSDNLSSFFLLLVCPFVVLVSFCFNEWRYFDRSLLNESDYLINGTLLVWRCVHKDSTDFCTDFIFSSSIGVSYFMNYEVSPFWSYHFFCILEHVENHKNIFTTTISDCEKFYHLHFKFKLDAVIRFEFSRDYILNEITVVSELGFNTNNPWKSR